MGNKSLRVVYKRWLSDMAGEPAPPPSFGDFEYLDRMTNILILYAIYGAMLYPARVHRAIDEQQEKSHDIDVCEGVRSNLLAAHSKSFNDYLWEGYKRGFYLCPSILRPRLVAEKFKRVQVL